MSLNEHRALSQLGSRKSPRIIACINTTSLPRYVLQTSTVDSQPPTSDSTSTSGEVDFMAYQTSLDEADGVAEKINTLVSEVRPCRKALLSYITQGRRSVSDVRPVIC